MKKRVLLLCVVGIVLLTGCDVWDLLANQPDITELLDELYEWMAYGDHTITLRVRRYGEQATASNPILWYVEGDIELALRPMHGYVFLFGDAVTANAGWTFSGGGCEGVGQWPVRLNVVGFLYGEPDCFIRLSVVETWLGGGMSTMTCPGVYTDSVVNDTLGYRFEELTFNASNQFFLERPGTGIPSPGAAGEDFGGWTWSSTWEITQIDMPTDNGCFFDMGP